MEHLKSYRELIVWQKSIDLNLLIYKHTKSFPKEEMFGLTSQLRRAAVSIAANIAVGQARNSSGEFRQFLGIAKGSLAELETLILISQNLEMISKENSIGLLDLLTEINKMLYALQKSISPKN